MPIIYEINSIKSPVDVIIFKEIFLLAIFMSTQSFFPHCKKYPKSYFFTNVDCLWLFWYVAFRNWQS